VAQEPDSLAFRFAAVATAQIRTCNFPAYGSSSLPRPPSKRVRFAEPN
jgi:hypothetical protein